MKPKTLCYVLFCYLSFLTPVTSQVSTQRPELLVGTSHSLFVLSIAFSPDSRTIVTGSTDHILKLWDVASARELRTFTGQSGQVNAVAISANGKMVASAGEDTLIRFWDINTGKELRVLEGHPGSVLCLSFSPDGSTLASGGSEGQIRLWDVATGAKLQTLGELVEGASVTSLDFSRDGKKLLSGSRDRTVSLWDLSANALIEKLAGHSGEVKSVRFSPDGKLLASAGEDGIRLWDPSTGRQLRPLAGHYRDVDSISFSPDGAMLASCGWDETLKVWDTRSWTILRSTNAGLGSLMSLAFSPDGKMIAAGGFGTVKVWAASSGKEVYWLTGHSAAIMTASLSSDEKTLAIGSIDGTVKLWDLATGSGLRLLTRVATGVECLAISPDNKTIASVGGLDETIKLWDVGKGNEERTLSGHTGSVYSVAFSPDGKKLVSGSTDKTIRVWDTATGLGTQITTGLMVKSLAFSPDGKTVASGGMESPDTKDGKIELWDITTGAKLRTLVGHSDWIASLAFSPDGKKLASGDETGNIRLWDVAADWVVELDGQYNQISSAAFSPDGTLLATGSWDNTIVLWDVSSGEKKRLLSGHSSRVSSVVFIGNGKKLLSAGWDTKTKVWDVASGEELASLIAVDEKDWIAASHEGLFDGSPLGWKEVLWRFNNNTFDYAPVEAFYNEFYHPGLLSEIMSGKRPKAPSDIAQKDRRQPQLKLTLNSGQAVTSSAERNVTARIDISQAPAGAQDVRLFRNGSLVKLWRGDVLQGKSSVTLETTIPIVAGENRLTAYAFNHDNIKSSDVTLTVTGAESLKRKGTLHILAIGVSQYANRDYNLDYTTDDATSFASQLKLEQEKLANYKSVEIKTLLNESATKENILAELKKLATAAQPEDAVIVYFSGHGKASGDHFYLVPHDLGYSGSRDQLSEEGLRQILMHSISDVELEEAFRTIDAGRLFMIIDACNSGQALENKDEPRRGPMNTRGLAQLAYEKGMYIMTASQSVEEAFVSEKLKHSYLTYALVEEGLKTKVADADHNGEISLREWFDYALIRVPKLREETLQSKSVVEETPAVRAVRGQKSQTPRVFYRREPDLKPLVVARP